MSLSRRFSLFTAIGLLFFSYRYLDSLSRHVMGMATASFIEEMTGAYAALLLLPLPIWVTRRFPWHKESMARAILAHASAAILFSAAKTTLMALSRAALFPFFGQGRYDYGDMLYRYPMEFSKDLMVYAVIAAFIYYFNREAAARATELRAAELQAQLAQSTLENLRLQLHPHFLFNTLNAISSVMYEDVRKADAMIARLSDFLRVILASTEVPEITLDEEIDIERMYLDIMKARLESRLQLSLDVDAGAGKAHVPSLILQPILENCIRHGMAERHELNIDIAASRKNGELQITVRDNGAGLGENARNGLGLTNVRSRLAQLYGDDGTFRIDGIADGGTLVTLAFPYRETA